MSPQSSLAGEVNVGYVREMRRFFAIIAFGIAGCSTTPVADFLDAVSPGGPGTRYETDPRRRTAGDDIPPRHGQNRERFDEPPPLPPVPVGYLQDGNEGSEKAPAARLQPRPTRPNE
jgi:hypothetical protein